MNSSTINSDPTPSVSDDSDRPFHRYLIVWIGLAGAMLVAAALGNVLIDPDYVYPDVSVDRLSPYRQNLNSRIAKSALVARNEADVILVGSSRTEVAFDPSNEAWNPERAVNAGLESTSILELARVVELAVQQPRTKTIVLLIDFLMFDARRGYGHEFERSLFSPERTALEFHLENLLGWRATKGSAISVARAALGRPTKRNPDGHLRVVAEKPRHRHMFRVTLGQFHREVFAEYERGDAPIATFRSILETARGASVRILVGILPVHALHLELIRASGRAEEFAEWKRELVRVVSEVSATAPGDEIPLWDFTGYHRYATESIPPDEPDAPEMRWFWENSHCRSELGALVVARMLDRVHPDLDPQFGVRLTPESIEDALARLESDGRRYRESEPEAMELLRSALGQR